MQANEGRRRASGTGHRLPESPLPVRRKPSAKQGGRELTAADHEVVGGGDVAKVNVLGEVDICERL